MTTTNRRERNRKFRKIQRVLAKALVVITILMVMGEISSKVIGFGGQILVTQAQLVHYHMEITDNQSVWEYNTEMAQMYPHIRSYQNDADEADARIAEYEDARYEVQHSSDPTVAFAARNGVDIPTILLGLACMASLILAWVGAFAIYRVFQRQLEKGMANLIYLVAVLSAATLYLLGTAARAVCVEICKIVENKKRQRARRKHHRSEGDGKDDKIVPFRRIG